MPMKHLVTRPFDFFDNGSMLCSKSLSILCTPRRIYIRIKSRPCSGHLCASQSNNCTRWYEMGVRSTIFLLNYPKYSETMP